MIESLESRRLLAVTANLVAGNLTVTGDNDSNSVVIRRDDAGHSLVRSSDVTVGTFNNADVSKITVSLLGGNDRLEIAAGVEKPSTVTGGDGNDSVTGGSGQDNIHGNAGNDQLRGGNGKDALFGDEGSDFLDGGGQGDDMNGGGGFDTVNYAGRAGAVKVTLDNVANDGFQATLAEPGEGDNVHSDIERIVGGNGNDNLSGLGAPGGVSIDGGPGNDLITGSTHNDSLNGNGGNDNLNGGEGNDFLNGGEGGDRMSGGGGIDQVSYADRLIGVNITLDGVANDGTPARAATATEPARPAEGDNVIGDVEKLLGSRGNDRIIANDAANTISGNLGNDYIDARGGNDVVEGGEGNDEIHGGAGNDKLYAGKGNDKLYGDDGNDWLYAKDSAADIVNGGGGTEDHAQRDEGLDTVTGVEFFIA